MEEPHGIELGNIFVLSIRIDKRPTLYEVLTHGLGNKFIFLLGVRVFFPSDQNRDRCVIAQNRFQYKR